MSKWNDKRRGDECTASEGVHGKGRWGWPKKKRKKNRGLKSSRDAQREETLRMTQFITITATKEWEGGKWRGECKRVPLCTAIH